jgi:hypothetical protein
VDANIQITPPTANNPVGTNHVLTCHVNVNNGSGAFANAPAGTTCTVSLQNAGGATASFVGPNSCQTVAATGSCTVTITSTTAGTTTIHATTTLSVGGVTLTRSTGDSKAGDSPDATKTWADAAVRTDVHDGSHAVITTVPVGTTVHDKVFVTKAAGTPAAVPNPTGNVVFHRYATIDCTGAAVDQTVALAADGTTESSTFTTTGDMSYKADYLGDANYPARSGACEPLASTPVGACPAAPAVFGLGPAGNYTVLGLEAANLIISEGATKVTGNVGLAKNGTGALLKSTIDGQLFLDPTAHPDIHSDLKITGVPPIVIKDMTPENNAAFAANLALAAMAPTQPAIGQITGNTTITGGPGVNVVSVAGVDMVKKTLTISGSASSVFIINVTGGFNFSSSSMVLAGGVQPNNIIWNFIGPGEDIDIFKTGTVAAGTFLAPYRNITQDHATLNGRYIGASNGLTLKMHSAATVTCP